MGLVEQIERQGKIPTPNPKCSKCYGRGYLGIVVANVNKDIVGKAVACKCMRWVAPPEPVNPILPAGSVLEPIPFVAKCTHCGITLNPGEHQAFAVRINGLLQGWRCCNCYGRLDFPDLEPKRD